MSESNFRKPWTLALPAISIVLLYGIGILFPDHFWGLHYPAFLPGILPGILFFLSLALAAFPLYQRFLPQAGNPFLPAPTWRKWLLFTGIAGIFGYLFWALPVAGLVYGDAEFIYPNVDGRVEVWNSEMLKQTLLLDFTDLKGGTNSFYALGSLLSYVLKIKVSTAVIGVEILAGMVFVLVWLWLVDMLIKDVAGKMLFSLLGCSAPILQVYFSHFEIYAVPITLNLCFFGAMVQVFRRRSRAWFAGMLVLLYFACKFHITGFLLVPGAIFGGIHTFGKREKREAPWITWRRATIYVLLPIMVLGTLAYFFVTKNAFGPRDFDSSTLEKVLFLPIVAREGAPLDGYNLFSGAHFFDLSNMLFLLSGPAVLLLLSAALHRPQGLRMRGPLPTVLGLSLALYSAAFFMLNPLMSMPIDWDLMSLMGPALLVFTLALWAPVTEKAIYPKLIGPVLGLALLSSATFYVNATPAALSSRLESVGKHSFRTYWRGSSSTLIQSLERAPDEAQRAQRLVAILAELKPAISPGKDSEYARLLVHLGKHYAAQAPEKPIAYYQQAHEIAPAYGEALFQLVLHHFHQQQFTQASQYLPGLVTAAFPTHQKALRIAIHTSLEAADYPAATQYAATYLQQWPQDALINEVHRDLRAGNEVETLKQRFGR